MSKARVEAIELVPDEAEQCESTMRSCRLTGKVSNGSFFAWAVNRRPYFDALVGNPPYVRYQYVEPRDRALAEKLTAQLGIELKGVSNLWIPFALVGMSLLRPGGAFALVLPGELFSTVSAGQFRSALVRDFSSVRLDLFPRDTFPDLLQDVVVVSGMRGKRPQDRRLATFCEHRRERLLEWKHTVEGQRGSWLQYLLTQDEVRAFHEASRLPDFYRLGDLAKIEVSIVTGANSFFTVDDSTLQRFGLEAWARPLLPKTVDCPGLVFNETDLACMRQQGSRALVIGFFRRQTRSERHRRVREYLALGSRRGFRLDSNAEFVLPGIACPRFVPAA